MKTWLIRIAIGSLVGLILFVGITFLRLQWVKYQIGQHSQDYADTVPQAIGETRTLEILPLYEKAGQDGLDRGHGVSYLIRTDDATVLFDLGNNLTASSPSPLQKNMDSLGISLEEIDTIVISHRHPDHVGGQNWWTEKTFSMDGMTQPSLGGIALYLPEAMTYPGSEPILAQKPALLSDGLATTGLITYAQPFPIWLGISSGDEQALAVNVSGQGIVLITGCGHMGLAALLQRAESAFDAPVVGVIGGLHYGDADLASLQPDIQLIRNLDPIVVGLSPHDSSLAVLNEFTEKFPGAYAPIMVGKPIFISGIAAESAD